MSSELHPSHPSPTYKPASFIGNALGWVKARQRDLMVAATVLHEIQWAAPWDEPESPKARSRRWVS